jgi:hypothetical protein
VKRCVEAGELDSQIDAASNAVRARFMKWLLLALRIWSD